jgi:GMP synthase (glutamine-hydrolysing)
MAAPVLVIDFGSQVTQLIARRVREAGVYCEIVPYDKAENALAEGTPQAIILSGGPARKFSRSAFPCSASAMAR